MGRYWVDDKIGCFIIIIIIIIMLHIKHLSNTDHFFFFFKAIEALATLHSIRSKHVVTKAKHISAILPPSQMKRKLSGGESQQNHGFY